MITEKDIKELEKKIKDKKTQREQIKKYKKLRFEYRYPLFNKIKNLFDRENL